MRTPFRLRPLLLTLGCLAALAGTTPVMADAPRAKPGATSTSKALPPLNSAQLLFQMFISEIALARGYVGDALFGYNELVKRSDDPALTRRANEIATASVILDARRHPAEAEASVKQALARQESARAGLLLQLPTIFNQMANKNGALESIRRLTEPYPSLPEAHLARAQAELEAGNRATAHQEAGLALSLRPDWEHAALLQAQSAPAEQFREAMEALGSFAQSHPAALDARLSYLRWLVNEHRNDEARALYPQMLAANPDNDRVAFAILGIAAQIPDLETTENLLIRLIDHHWGDTPQLRLLLGKVQETRGHPAEALATYDTLLPGPNFANAQIQKARLLYTDGKPETALASLRKALEASPADATALHGFEAQILRQTGHLAEAQAILEEILRVEPDHLESLYDAALLAEQLGQYAAMEQRLRHVLELNPDHAQALNALGYSLVDRNLRLDEAETLLGKAIALEPDDAAILDSVGWLRFRQGKTSEALDYLQRAYKQFPDTEVAGHLIEVLWLNGQRDSARKLMQDALKASPESIPLKSLAARLGL